MSTDIKNQRVADVMRKDVVLIDGMDLAIDALRMMVEKDLEVVFVDKRSDGDEYGMVTLTDIVNDVLAHNRPVKRLNVYEIMIKPIVAVHSGMKLRYCARLFANLGIFSAPVIDEEKIIGLVCHRHLAAGFMKPLSE